MGNLKNKIHLYPIFDYPQMHKMYVLDNNDNILDTQFVESFNILAPVTIDFKLPQEGLRILDVDKYIIKDNVVFIY